MAKSQIDLGEDAQKPLPSNTQLQEIAWMVNHLLSLEVEYVQKESELKMLGQKIERISATDIPEAMKIIGLTMYRLEDGRTVEVKSDDYGSYTKENEPEVFKWLRNKGHGDLIKSAVGIILGKGREHLVEKLHKVLNQKAFEGCVVEFKESIHGGTFKAFVREQLMEGKSLPKQIAIFHKSETIIKEPNHGATKKQTSSKASKDFF